MNRFTILTRYLMMAVVLAVLSACSGGGDGGGSSSDGTDGNGGSNTTTFTATLLQPLAGTAFSVATAINGANEAVGISDGGTTAPTTMKAVVWTVTVDGAATTSAVSALAMPPGAGAYSAAYGNNNGGAIVGEVESTPGGAIVPAFWPSRTATPAQVVLMQLGTATRGAAYGINTAGRIVGELLNGGLPAAATWTGSGEAPAILTAAGFVASSAYFINDAGEIVGEATDAAGSHATLWQPNAAGAYATGPILMPTTSTLNGNSIALAINTAGTVTGEVKDNTGKVHAVQWTRDTAGTYTLVDLAPAGAESSAACINDEGRVAGHTVAGTSEKARAWKVEAKSPPKEDVLIDSETDDAAEISEAYAINANNLIAGVKGVQAFIARPK